MSLNFAVLQKYPAVYSF